MAIYMVLVPPGVSRGTTCERDLERAVFLKDGFSFVAFLFSVPWLLWQRLWLVLGAFLVVTIALELAARLGGGAGAGLVSLLATFLFALEANSLHRWTLERRGWRFAAVVEARNRADAERRFFTALATAPSAATPASLAAPAATQAARTAPGPAPRISREQVVGMTLGLPRH